MATIQQRSDTPGVRRDSGPKGRLPFIATLLSGENRAD